MAQSFSVSRFILISLMILLSLPGCAPSPTGENAVPLEQPPVSDTGDMVQPITPIPLAMSRLMEPEMHVIDISLEEKIPSDLTEQLFSVGGLGAGGGGWEETVPGPAYWQDSYDGSTLPALPRTLYWAVANLAFDPFPDVSLTLPDGNIIPLEGGFIENVYKFTYDIIPGSLLGEYEIRVEQGDTLLTDTVTLSLPIEPIYAEYGDGFWISGFQPGEQVRISFYFYTFPYQLKQPEVAAYFPNMEIPLSLDEFDCCLSLYLNQSTLQTDENGSFILQTSSDLPFLGSSFTRVFLIEGIHSALLVNPEFSYLVSCQDVPHYRLRIGDIATDKDGKQYSIVRGPFCMKRNLPMSKPSWMWFAEIPEGYTTLEVESNEDGYLLEAIDP